MLWLVLCLVVVPVVTANGRLPNHTVPLHYDLHLEVTGLGLGDYSYRGNVSIRIAIARDTDQIVLHNLGNALGTISVRRCRDGVQIPHQVLETDESSELLHIRTDRVLDRVDDKVIQLVIEFNNTLGEDHMGFYRTQYRGPKRVPMAVATTHFQPSYARMAFPCFDEPGLKSTFDITIVSNASHLVASNAPIETISWLLDGYKVVRFERTPPMQTYLVSFLIADFTSVHATSHSGVKVGILAPPKDEKMLQYSLQAATTLLTSLEQYTGQSLGLSKLDHAAIPAFGNAMENWGLVSYDEQFLVLSANSHRLQRAQAVLTIAHETAHQLFGNLVGPAWWSYLWLSEGFATYFEILLGSEVYPDLLPLEDTFAVRHMRPALLADAFDAHALTVEPLPADSVRIEMLFDTITYSKAGCILRMINCSIGETDFKSGVRRYLETYRDGIVSPGELYGSFTQELPEGPTVEQIFRSWADKPGYPVVMVERLNSSFVRFRQERYQQETASRDTQSRWHIPITYYTNSSAGKYEYQPAFWMKESDQELVVRLEMSWQDVLVVNPRQIGFYRVEYDDRGWNSIVDILSSLPPIMQAKLVDDAFVLARVGMVGYEVCLGMLQELAANPNPVPWLIAMAEENVGFLQRVLQSEEFDRFVAGFVGEMFGLAETFTRSLFQSQALERAFDWWARLANPTGFAESKTGSSGNIQRSACPPLSVQKILEGLVSPDEVVRDRLFARLKCQPNHANEPLLVALEQVKERKLLTCSKLLAVLESLIKSHPGDFLHPIVRFLSTVDADEMGQEAQRLQHLLNIIIHEVTDRGQAAEVQKLIVKNASVLEEHFPAHANTVMTSTISWRMKQVPKLREFVADSRMASYYGKEGEASSLTYGA
ncbi:glutamyl aminopeptidase-like [Anopheles maculipalpis]|uniref:glutamyl aminopeptidase-like n=1 Tax=Anopheles maculipalpis TaxID=1496333 RepID=UPI002158EFB6|nr:glutamyl aminopeptidase-like [Anopheles maculipalpis]